MSELKPCKKCGSNSNLTSGSDRDGNYVYCKCSPRKWVDLKVWQSEPTIKVSELKQFLQATIDCGDMANAEDMRYCEGYNDAYENVKRKFCGGKDD